MPGRPPDRANLTFRDRNEGYRLGRVHSDAARAATTGHYVWREEPDALRGRLSLASLPVAHRFQGRRGPARGSSPAEPPLQRRRDAAGAALPDDSRPGTPREHAAAPPERRLSVPHGLAELSGGDHAPPVPAAGGPNGAAETPGPARSLPAGHDRPAAGSPPADLRRGLHSVGRLRHPGAGPDRLQ